MQPPSEMVHWLFGMGVLMLGLLMLAEVIVGREVWARRPWRAYLWPGLAFGLGVGMWPVMTFFTNSAIHMVAHGAWAQALMVMGGAELGLARGRLHSRWWKLATPIGIAVSYGVWKQLERERTGRVVQALGTAIAFVALAWLPVAAIDLAARTRHDARLTQRAVENAGAIENGGAIDSKRLVHAIDRLRATIPAH